MADNPLAKLPIAGQVGVGLAIAAVMGGAFWYFSWQVDDEVLQKKLVEAKTLDAQITELKTLAKDLPRFEQQVATLRAQLEDAKKLLPEEKDAPELIKQVQRTAQQLALSIKKFDPGAIVAKEFYQEYPINLQLQGDYHSFALFCDRVGQLPRLVNVNNVKIKPLGKQTPGNTVDLVFVASTYVWVEMTQTQAKR